MQTPQTRARPAITMTEPFQIIHGDCLDVLRSMPDASVDAVVTDPPYGLGKVLKGAGEWGTHYKDGPPFWDSETCQERIDEALRVARYAIVWGGQYYALPPSRGWLIWDKKVRKFTSGHAELAWSNLEQPIRAFNYGNGELQSEGKRHPTQKPVPLMAWCLSFLPDDVSSVLDPFAGSGSTGVACAQRGLSFIGIEQHAPYVEIARARVSAAYAQTTLDLQ